MNPKVEVVEELLCRRKNLHLGMCKLLLEDLALKIEQLLADRKADAHAGGIRDSVIMELAELTRAHKLLDAADFNEDEKYKELMTQAIDSKKYALLKMDIYLESSAATADQPTDLNSIRDTPFKRLSDPTEVLQLRTGITNFPWADVVTHKRAEIDLKDWDAGQAAPRALESVAATLGGNGYIRVVTVYGVKLALSDGWATAWLDLSDNTAVKALPVTVAVVLRNCRALTSLNLWCDARVTRMDVFVFLPNLTSISNGF